MMIVKLNTNKIKKETLGLFLLFVFFINGCGIYSMSGVNTTAKTATVKYFPNKARIVAPILSQVFTEKLQDKLTRETNLELVNEQADLNFSGSITRYAVQPVASGSNDIADLSRLTIGVQVKFSNVLTSEEWSSDFSRYADFDKAVNLKDVEDGLIDEISQQLVDDIFNKALVNW